MISGLDFLALAETWINGPTEVEWRSAVSRAYYGAFHSARALMDDLGFQVPRADRAHSYLWLRLSNCGAAIVCGAGADLNLLRSERNRADYNVAGTLLVGNARIQVQAARRIVRILAAAALEPTRTQITDAMKIYERDVLRDVTWAP